MFYCDLFFSLRSSFSAFENAYKKLTPSERKYLSGNRRLYRQRIMAYYLLKRTLGDFSVSIEHGNNGRPFIKEPFDVSMSHCKEAVFVGYVSEPHLIGLDLEKALDKKKIPLFRKFLFSNNEIKIIDESPLRADTPMETMISLVWSLKEACLKCIGDDIHSPKIELFELSRNKAKLMVSDVFCINCYYIIRWPFVLSMCVAKRVAGNIIQSAFDMEFMRLKLTGLKNMEVA